MKYSSKILSQTVVQLCLAKGIEHIVISPGSRNAPLTIGFTNHSSFHCYSIVDERSAAFFAMGMAQQLRKPVALVCTSGSALLNYYPAVAEAFYSHIPLVVLSADRPMELIDVGDGQTIRQENVFANHILQSANLIEGDEFQEFNETIINEALNAAIQDQGPVHINVPFSEPLYELLDSASVHPKNEPPTQTDVSLDGIEEVLNKWEGSAKKIILVGALAPESLEERWIDVIANDPSVLVFTETLSNLHHPNFISAIDQLITALDENGFEKLQPDYLITLGGMIVSKRIKSFLRKYAPKEHWHVGTQKANDTFFKLTHHFGVTPNLFFNNFFANSKTPESTYQRFGLDLKEYRRIRHQEFLKEVPYCDFSVYHTLFESIPRGTQLHLANSAAVRYAQLFDSNPDVMVYCNRGTSGIDGSTSTAVGGAVARNIPSTLITGDLSFFYDSNALWNAYTPAHFRVIIINNGGGGIFRILPKAQEMHDFETFYETKHQLTAKHLCEMHGWEYQSAEDVNSLEEAISRLYEKSQAPKILEVFTPSEDNDKVLKGYFKAIE